MLVCLSIAPMKKGVAHNIAPAMTRDFQRPCDMPTAMIEKAPRVTAGVSQSWVYGAWKDLVKLWGRGALQFDAHLTRILYVWVNRKLAVFGGVRRHDEDRIALGHHGKKAFSKIQRHADAAMRGIAFAHIAAMDRHPVI